MRWEELQGWTLHEGKASHVVLRTEGTVPRCEVGKTTITASYAGNATYKAGYVSYILTVKAAKGDVNHDGKIDQTDVALTAQHILGKKPDGFFEASAHMNNDGVINAADLVLIVAEANKP